MYERVKRLYLAGRLSEAGLENAVEKGWISNEQRTEILEAANAEG